MEARPWSRPTPPFTSGARDAKSLNLTSRSPRGLRGTWSTSTLTAMTIWLSPTTHKVREQWMKRTMRNLEDFFFTWPMIEKYNEESYGKRERERSACVRVRMCVCVRACVRECVRAWVRACVRACVCVSVCACWGGGSGWGGVHLCPVLNFHVNVFNSQGLFDDCLHCRRPPVQFSVFSPAPMWWWHGDATLEGGCGRSRVHGPLNCLRPRHHFIAQA